MGYIQDRFNDWRNKKQTEKEMKKNYWKEREIEDEFQQRGLSHYERELFRHKEEIRQKRIKEIVKRIRKQDDRKFWSGRDKNLINAPNVFLNHKKIFNSGNMFANQKNFFNGHQDYFKNHKKLFKLGRKR